MSHEISSVAASTEGIGANSTSLIPTSSPTPHPGQTSDASSASGSSSPSSSSTTTKNTGAIIGGAAAGSIAVVLAMLFLLWKCCRHGGGWPRRDSFTNIQPYVDTESRQTTAPIGSVQPSLTPIVMRQQDSQDFLTLTSSPPSTVGAALSHNATEDGLLARDTTSHVHDSLIAQASTRRGRSHPPKYAVPGRRMNLASKWSDESPQPASALSTLPSQTTTEPITAVRTSERATVGHLSSRNHENWEPSAPSEFSDEPPPRYYF